MVEFGREDGISAMHLPTWTISFGAVVSFSGGRTGTEARKLTCCGGFLPLPELENMVKGPSAYPPGHRVRQVELRRGDPVCLEIGSDLKPELAGSGPTGLLVATSSGGLGPPGAALMAGRLR